MTSSFAVPSQVFSPERDDHDEEESHVILPPAFLATASPRNRTDSAASSQQMSRRYQREATEEVEVTPLVLLWNQQDEQEIRPEQIQSPSNHSIYAFEDASNNIMAEKTSFFADSNVQVDIITRSSFEPPDSLGTASWRSASSFPGAFGGDDDDLSQSSTFYEPKDFQAETWIGVVYSHMDYTSMAGLALFATAAVIVHPLVLLAGAATAVWAVGSVHAIQHGYEFFTDGSFSRLFWNDPPEGLAENATFQERLACAKEQAQLLEEARSMDESSEGAKTTVTTSLSSSDAEESSLKAASSTRTFTRDEEGDDELPPLNSQWVHMHFPSLQNEVVANVEFWGLNAHEFFHVFFSDEAPYSFMTFQQKRGDIDIAYGKWHGMNPGPLSMHPRSKMVVDNNIAEHNIVCQERTLTFKTLTKSYFGPAYASATKTQRVILSKRLMILESITRLANIPFCDRFQVMERWVLVSQKRDEMGDCKLAWLSVNSEVQILRSCAFEQQIRTKSFATLQEIVTSWCEMALEALKLTTQNKRQREERQDACSPSDSYLQGIVSTSIEQEENLLAQHEYNFYKMDQQLMDGVGLENIEVKYSYAAGRSRSFAQVVGEADYLSDVVNTMSSQEEEQDEFDGQPTNRVRSFSAFRRGMLDRMKRRQTIE